MSISKQQHIARTTVYFLTEFYSKDLILNDFYLVILTMGEDFFYLAAEVWFKNMDKLIK